MVSKSGYAIGGANHDYETHCNLRKGQILNLAPGVEVLKSDRILKRLYLPHLNNKVRANALINAFSRTG